VAANNWTSFSFIAIWTNSFIYVMSQELPSVSFDIDPILRDWPFLPNEVNVRLVKGEDGRQKVQLRLDLGLLQMEIDGRPDGRRIHECDSWLEYHERRQRDHDAANPDGVPYLLEPEDCAELQREGVQYYHRYISLWHLGRYELCARDTLRNLRLFAFVRNHARNDRDKLQFDQWRPYVTMMHARAVATPLVELEQWDAATGVVEAAIRGIERFLDDYDQSERAAEIGELKFLQQWREEIIAQRDARGGRSLPDASPSEPRPRKIVDRKSMLRESLKEAILEERYEDAARIRNELRQHDEETQPTDRSNESDGPED
jgi:hypothetical protein